MLRAAVIIEDHQGNRMIYRVIPDHLDVRDRRFDGPIHHDMYVSQDPDYAITLEGTLTDGKVWAGDMPQQQPQAITDGPRAIEQ